MRTVRAAVVVTLLIALFVGCIGLAQTFGPRDLLTFQSADADAVERDLARARSELQRSLVGLSGDLEFRPEAGFDGSLEDFGNDTEFGFGFDLALDVGYRYDAVDILRRRIDVINLQQRLADLQRRDVLNALLLYVDLIRAEREDRGNQERLADAREALAEARAKFAEEAINATELREAELDLEEARIRAERSRQNLEALRDGVTRRGVNGSPAFEAVRFQLPAGAVEETLGFQRRRLELARDEIAAEQDSFFGVIENVSVSAGYDGNNASLGAGVSVDRGRPGASLGTTLHEPSTSDSWSITFRAKLRIDDRTITDFTRSAASLERQRQEFAAFLDEYDLDRDEALAAVELRLRELQLAEERLELGARRIAELEGELDELGASRDDLRATLDERRQQRDAAEGERRSELDAQAKALEAELSALEADIRDVERDLADRRNRRSADEDLVFRSWREYVRAVGSYLAVVDGRWEVTE